MRTGSILLLAVALTLTHASPVEHEARIALERFSARQAVWAVPPPRPSLHIIDDSSDPLEDGDWNLAREVLNDKPAADSESIFSDPADSGSSARSRTAESQRRTKVAEEATATGHSKKRKNTIAPAAPLVVFQPAVDFVPRTSSARGQARRSARAKLPRGLGVVAAGFPFVFTLHEVPL